MIPTAPAPYGHSSYAMPATPVRYAQRVTMDDGASIATFVYGPAHMSLNELLRNDPVLALHGNGGSHSTFVKVIDALAAANKGVIAIDSRAQGQSTRGTLPLTYELFATDVVAVLDHLGVQAAHVVGHSDGGIEALLLARDYPTRVLSIVAGGANITPEAVIDEWDTAGSAASMHAWANYWDGSESASEERPAQVDPTLISPSPAQARIAAELLQLMLDEPHISAGSLGAISCPACILVGEHDCIERSQTEAIANAIPAARLVTIPGVGHSLPRQAPDSVALQVLTNVVLVG